MNFVRGYKIIQTYQIRQKLTLTTTNKFSKSTTIYNKSAYVYNVYLPKWFILLTRPQKLLKSRTMYLNGFKPILENTQSPLE